MLFNSTCETLVDVLTYRGQNNATKNACIFLGKGDSADEITYEKLADKAKLIALYLKENGLKKGDRALLIFVPGLELTTAFFGCLYAGVIAVPVYPPINPKLLEKTKRVVKNSTPNIILSTEESIIKFATGDDEENFAQTSNKQRYFEKLPCLATDKLLPATLENWQQPALNRDDIAFLQYTSGSTMHPKGVMVNHGNLLDNLAKIYRSFGLHADTIFFSWLPPYHDMGLIGNLLTPIYGGLSLVQMTPFSFLQNPVSWLKNIQKYKATFSGAPNFAYDYCVKRIKEEKKEGLDLSSWQLAFNGAEPIKAETMERFYQAFKNYGFKKEAFYPCYGLAEATLLATGGPLGVNYRTVRVAKEHFQENKVHFVEEGEQGYTLVSSGQTIQTIKIVDPDTLIECGKDTVGEIWINGPSVAAGYWQQPEETELAFKGKIADDPSNVDYLRTGDLGFIHDDELYVTGRIKDLIILYGKNHYPQDIEYTLHHCAFHHLLGDCAAFVMTVENDYRLTVMCEVKNRYLEKAEQEYLFNSIFETVYQQHELEIHTIVLIPSKTIPKTTSGKIRRNFCRQHLGNNTIPVIATWQLMLDEKKP
ncbi:MAG: fatty acyl-AMP ligase [Legionella sp.]|nr:fatty acyl-AMP ligase [Legionella sp.]